MAYADGEFCQEEYELLKQIAKRNHITENQLKEIRDNVSKIDFEVATDEKEKFQELYDLVHMMTADKKIHKEEMNLCDALAVKFGYSSEKVKDIIQAVRLNIENGNSYEETMKRVSMLMQLGV